MVTASAQPASDRPLTVPPRWGFLTNHAVILVYVILHPESTVRAISAGVGVTERACLAILRDLDDDGIIIRHRDGRRNTYAVDFDRLSGVRRGGTATPLTPRPFVEGVIRMLYDIARERGLVSHHHEPRRRQDHQLEARAGTWGFFTNHLLVLLAVARDHRSTVRDIAVAVGITERAAVGILNQLEDEQVIARERVGRRNTYTIDFERFRTFRGWEFGDWEVPPPLIDAATSAVRSLSSHSG